MEDPILSFYNDILQYSPADETEQQVKDLLLKELAARGEKLFLRESEDLHLTASSIILDPSFTQTLMVYHNIYQAVTWTGGHADGEHDLLQTALREAREETGITQLWPLTSRILSIDLLDVKAHCKKGKPVPAHKHITVNYGLIAPMGQQLRIAPQENSAVLWVPLTELAERCSAEPHMVPVYQKLICRMQQVAEQKQQALGLLPQLLLPWYQTNARDLPWRRTHDPYAIWLAEIMLQQTRVEAVKAYYTRFLQALPTIEALAAAEETQLMKLWEGLGYYRRARHLQLAAQQIVREHGGVFPHRYDEIRALPGIGDYTAGAIASQCFDAPTPAVDGNVLRVLARYTEDYRCTDDPALKRTYTQYLAPLYPAGQCSEFTQSLMEVGATVCVPNGAPHCSICPLAAHCAARLAGTVQTLPVRKEKRGRKKEQRTVFLLRCGERIAVCKRGETGLLAGLWELPNVSGKLTAQQALEQAAAWHTKPHTLMAELQREHIFTHIEWQMTAYEIQCEAESPAFTWADATMLQTEIPLPSAFRQFITV